MKNYVIWHLIIPGIVAGIVIGVAGVLAVLLLSSCSPQEADAVGELTCMNSKGEMVASFSIEVWQTSGEPSAIAEPHGLYGNRNGDRCTFTLSAARLPKE